MKERIEKAIKLLGEAHAELAEIDVLEADKAGIHGELLIATITTRETKDLLAKIWAKQVRRKA